MGIGASNASNGGSYETAPLPMGKPVVQVATVFNVATVKHMQGPLPRIGCQNDAYPSAPTAGYTYGIYSQRLCGTGIDAFQVLRVILGDIIGRVVMDYWMPMFSNRTRESRVLLIPGMQIRNESCEFTHRSTYQQPPRCHKKCLPKRLLKATARQYLHFSLYW